MEFDDRVKWLLLGCLIGFVLGYIVRSLKDIKEELHEVDDVLKGACGIPNDEQGSIRIPRMQEIGLFIVVLLTVYSSFQAGYTNMRLNKTVNCITKYNTYQGKAMTGRDTAIKQGTDSEIHLWTQYGRLYALATKNPLKIPEAQEKLNQAVAAHRDALIDTQATRVRFPYAGPDVLKNCKEK